MHIVVLALLLATATGQPGGRLYVHVMPGVQVLIDGAAAGVTTAEENGKLIKGVASGPHHVVIRSEDGREAAFNIVINDGQTSEVNVSPLGFRKLNRPNDDDTGLLRVTSIPADSIVEFHGVTRENHDGTELTFDAIPPGKYPVTVTEGGKTIHADVEVPKGSIVTVEVNFAKATIRTTETKLKPRRLQLSDPNDALSRLDVPSHWKTAIRSALPATVSLLDAASQNNGVRVRLKVPSEKMGDALLESLSSSSAFSRVSMASDPRREQTGWVVDFLFVFP